MFVVTCFDDSLATEFCAGQGGLDDVLTLATVLHDVDELGGAGFLTEDARVHAGETVVVDGELAINVGGLLGGCAVLGDDSGFETTVQSAADATDGYLFRFDFSDARGGLGSFLFGDSGVGWAVNERV